MIEGMNKGLTTRSICQDVSPLYIYMSSSHNTKPVGSIGSVGVCGIRRSSQDPTIHRIHRIHRIHMILEPGISPRTCNFNNFSTYNARKSLGKLLSLEC